MTLDQGERSRAAKLLETVDAASAGWGPEGLAFVAQAAAARAALGLPPVERSGLGAAIATMIGAPPGEALWAPALALPRAEGDLLLSIADGFVPAAAAPALAELLATRGLAPSSRRLAALLGAHAPERAARLIADSAGTAALQALADAWCAAHDRGATAALEPLWQRTFGRPQRPDDPDAWRAGRLRRLAREDPARAFTVLDDDLDAYDVIGLGEGVTAAIVRAPVGSVVTRVGQISGLVRRAVILAELAWRGALPAAAQPELDRLLDHLERPPRPMDLHPRAQALAAMALVDLAARLGDHALASQVVRQTGLAPGWAFVATWVSARRRALREGCWDPDFWAALSIADADGPAAYHCLPPSPLLDARVIGPLWQVLVLPLPELPWFEAWEGGLP